MEMRHPILEAFISPNEADINGEHANVVDGLFRIARALERIGKALEAANQETAANNNRQIRKL